MVFNTVFNEDENKFEKNDSLKNHETKETAVKDKPNTLCINRFSSM